MHAIEVQHVSKKFKQQRVLEDIHFTIEDGPNRRNHRTFRDREDNLDQAYAGDGKLGCRADKNLR